MSSSRTQDEAALANLFYEQERYRCFETIPLQPIMGSLGSFRADSRHQLNEQGDKDAENDDTSDGATAGSSSMLLPERPLLTPSPPPSSPPPSPTDSKEDTADTQDDGQENKPSSRRCYLYFLFYATFAQPCVKTMLCVTVMFVDVKLDNDCHYKGCSEPVYTRDKVIYFLVCVALFGVGCVQICIGLLLFAKKSVINPKVLKMPLRFLKGIIVMEVAMLALAILITTMKHEVLAGALALLVSEAIAVLVSAVGFSSSRYTTVDNNATRLKEMLGQSGVYWPSLEW